MTTAEKVKLAVRTETVYLADRQAKGCQFSHDRVAWRLENGRVVLIHYRIYRSDNAFGQPAVLVDRGESGIEIMLALAYQVYVVGVSIDKACQLLNFFEQLKLGKSQARCFAQSLGQNDLMLPTWVSQLNHLLTNAAVIRCRLMHPT